MDRQLAITGADGAQVPHPPGVRDLKRARLDQTRALWDKGVAGTERRRVVSQLTKDSLASHFLDVTGGAEGGLALAAVGSVGRGDAGPVSDLDLVLLHDGSVAGGKDGLTRLAHELWYPIWDAGLSLDYSVRSLVECRQVASKDLPAAAGLLDIQLVAGDDALVQQARTAIYQDWRAASRKRLPELLNASRARAERSGELAYLIEPNIKDSRGGLRDYVSLTGLSATWLTDRPRGDVDRAAQHLMDVRDAMHLVAGRPVVMLGRHVADDVAQLLGFSHPDDLLRSLAEAGRTIAYAVELTERGARRSAERARVGSRAWKARRLRGAPRHTVVADGLIDVDGELALAPQAVPGDDALLGLRAAAAASTTGVAMTPGLLSRLQECPPLPVPWPAAALHDFLTMLRGPHLLAVWEAIDLAGVLGTWIPAWQEVRNRPQRSPVHQYTVDRHLIEAVLQAQHLRRKAPDPDLLLLAAVFHDIGKRPGADDHSVTGAEVVAAIAQDVGLDQGRARTLQSLVRHHLVLAELATSKDHEDPAVVDTVLEAVNRNPDTLVTLRLLTEADAKAAGPKAWTPWRAALVEGLYQAAVSRLERH